MPDPTRMVDPAPSYKQELDPAELDELRAEDVARRAEDEDPTEQIGEEVDPPEDAGEPATVVDDSAADEPDRDA